MFWAEIWKISELLLEKFVFVLKVSIYLKKRGVFVMQIKYGIWKIWHSWMTLFCSQRLYRFSERQNRVEHVTVIKFMRHRKIKQESPQQSNLNCEGKQAEGETASGAWNWKWNRKQKDVSSFSLSPDLSPCLAVILIAYNYLYIVGFFNALSSSDLHRKSAL